LESLLHCVRRDMVGIRVVVIVTLFSAGCLSQIIPEHAPAEEPEVQQMLAQKSFESGGGFTRVGKVGFASTLEPGKLVTMFVSSDAAAAYAAVSPDVDATAGPAFPVGGTIVRAVADERGTPVGFAVMVKREPGYFPEAGDFFFGVTDLDGNPQPGEDGLEWGALPSCGTCHHTRAAAGYLFGVPKESR
jgi:hypothetical protein